MIAVIASLEYLRRVSVPRAAGSEELTVARRRYRCALGR
jgi:hypothetical protein